MNRQAVYFYWVCWSEGVWVISKFNGTPTPKGSYSAKTGVNCTMSLSRVYQKRIPWSNECKVQGKMSSHILKKSPIALTYSRIVEGVTESKSFVYKGIRQDNIDIQHTDDIQQDIDNVQRDTDNVGHKTENIQQNCIDAQPMADETQKTEENADNIQQTTNDMHQTLDRTQTRHKTGNIQQKNCSREHWQWTADSSST